jgi:hypothetical protein
MALWPRQTTNWLPLVQAIPLSTTPVQTPPHDGSEGMTQLSPQHLVPGAHDCGVVKSALAQMVMLLGFTQAVAPSALLWHTLAADVLTIEEALTNCDAAGKIDPQLMAKSHLFVSAQQTVPPAQSWVTPGIKSKI